MFQSQAAAPNASTLSSIQLLINGPSTSATTTRATAAAAHSAITTETALARTKPRVSSRSYALFSDHITVCIAPLSDHRASPAPTAIIGPPCWAASTCFRLWRASSSALAGTTLERWSSSELTESGPATLLKMPRASSRVLGIARKALNATACARWPI